MPNDPLDPDFPISPYTQQAASDVVSDVARQTAEIPQRAFAASENLRLGGSYDPGPVLAGATVLGVGAPFAEAGSLGVAGGRAAARVLSGEERAGELGMAELAERYPQVGPPILKDAKTNKPIAGVTGKKAQAMVDAGTAYWGKKLTPEAELVKKARTKAQADIEAGNYTPYFKVSERSNVNPTRYPPYKSTVGQYQSAAPKPETIKKYMAHATNPAGAARLQAAYEEGLKQEGSANWYFMHQLEQEFIKEYGEQGPAMFKQRVADALAATTGGADPQANVLSASFANYLAAKGEDFPTVSHQVPFPVGGGKHGIMPNLEQYQKMMLPGGTGVTPANPKRYNFSANILGEAQAGTIDEQMSKLFDPKMSQPEHYGPYQQALNDLAQANGVDPRYFQEVAWAGAKAMKEGYKAKPLIQTYNEAIERTSRITGVPPAEVVRRGIVRAEMPIYGTAGVIGASQLLDQQSPSEDAATALGAGAQ